MRLIALLGGTFDPVHNGHSRIALDIADKCVLESIRFVPNARSPLRDSAKASNIDRIAMLELALATDDRFCVDQRELQREPPSYTVDTLQSLRDELPTTPLCFILGTDAFMQFHLWHCWQDIPGLAHLLIAARPGCEISFQDKALRAMFNERKTENVDDLHDKASGRIYMCDVTQVNVSATQIRENVAAGKSLEGLVCEPVAHYIEQHGLYNE